VGYNLLFHLRLAHAVVMSSPDSPLTFLSVNRRGMNGIGESGMPGDRAQSCGHFTPRPPFSPPVSFPCTGTASFSFQHSHNQVCPTCFSLQLPTGLGNNGSLRGKSVSCKKLVIHGAAYAKDQPWKVSGFKMGIDLGGRP